MNVGIGTETAIPFLGILVQWGLCYFHWKYGNNTSCLQGSVQLDAKLSPQRYLNGFTTDLLVHILDQVFKRSFLVDIWRSYNIFCHCYLHSCPGPASQGHLVV
jgi:hypothetical protein